MTRQSLRQQAGPILLALVIGVLAGLGAMFFRWLIGAGQYLLWPSGANFAEQVSRAPWWLVLLVPAGMGLLLGPVIHFWAPETSGPGVPEVMAALALHGGVIRHRVTLFKTFITGGLISAGASVGREGPIVQIGSSIGSSLSQLLKLPLPNRRLAVACGAAGGIAATFQAPMAGTLFAVEVLLSELEVASLSPIVVAAVSGTMVARLFTHRAVIFQVPTFVLRHPAELVFHGLIGILGGLTGLLLMWLIFRLPRLWRRLRIPGWLGPGVGGLLAGLIALKVPGALGVGYESISLALGGHVAVSLVFLLLAAKLFTTSICLSSGMSGGIFAPSLFIGAMGGSIVGFTVRAIWPALTTAPADYALIGMGAMVSGTTLAPITAILTIFELTYNYQVILPLMVACIMSALTVRLLYGYSIYETKLRERGIDIVRGREVNIMRGLKVRDHMHSDFETFRTDTPCPEVVSRMEESPFPHFPVLDRDGRLAGILSPEDCRHILAHPDRCTPKATAADIMTGKPITVSEEADLEKAFHTFLHYGFSFLPVVREASPWEVVGQLRKSDLLAAYDQHVLKEHTLRASGQASQPGKKE
jgi:CIC family chloride channel protein